MRRPVSLQVLLVCPQLMAQRVLVHAALVCQDGGIHKTLRFTSRRRRQQAFNNDTRHALEGAALDVRPHACALVQLARADRSRGRQPHQQGSRIVCVKHCRVLYDVKSLRDLWSGDGRGSSRVSCGARMKGQVCPALQRTPLT